VIDLFASVTPLIVAILSALWVVGAWRRTRHLARYFQLEGYETSRYVQWLRRTKREYRPFAAGLAAFLALFWGSLLNVGFIVYLAVGFGLAVGFLVLQPRDTQVKQPFVRTPRAVRLLAVARLLSIFPPAFYGIMALVNGGRGSPDTPLMLAFFGATSGVTAMILAHAAHPLANVLLFPVEQAVRHKYMRLAKERLQGTGACVICITGSYGKTSTKHYLQHFLSARYNTAMTPKSYNTLMGISRYVNDTFATPMPLDYFIAEADAYFVGENASICRLVEPHIGVVVSVGPMHLERLGSMANVATAQYEIIDSLPADGVGVFNGDDPLVREMAERGHPQTRLIISQKGATGATLEAREVVLSADGVRFTLYHTPTGESAPLYAPLYGETNITNILLAAAVAHHVGLPLRDIGTRAATLQPADHRLMRRVFPDGTVILDDAYSANPVGTKAALEVLNLHRQGAHRIVISSGMFELGAESDTRNEALGEHMAACATDVILIGAKQAAPIRVGALAKGFPAERLHVVATLEDALALYRTILTPGDTLLMLTDLPDVYAHA